MFARSFLSFAALTAASVWAQAPAIAEEAPSVCTVMIAEGRPETGEYRIVFSTQFSLTPEFKHKGADGDASWKIEGWLNVNADYIQLSFAYSKPDAASRAFTIRMMLPPGRLICLPPLEEANLSTSRDFFFIRRSAPDAPPPTAQEFAKAIAEGIEQRKRALPTGRLVPPSDVAPPPVPRAHGSATTTPTP